MLPSSFKAEPDIEYPDSDGEPMGETGFHVRTIIALYQDLKWVIFAGRSDVYVTADMFVYI